MLVISFLVGGLHTINAYLNDIIDSINKHKKL